MIFCTGVCLRFIIRLRKFICPFLRRDLIMREFLSENESFKNTDVAALYLRLSKEDIDKMNGGDDSESIKNQRILLTDEDLLRTQS